MVVLTASLFVLPFVAQSQQARVARLGVLLLSLVTGTVSYLPDLVEKHLEIVKKLVPRMKHLAVFYNPANPLAASNLRDLDDPARLLAIQIHALKVLDPGNSRTPSVLR
jgi:ABC-type uncharacterized transport system substrate-binding protein